MVTADMQRVLATWAVKTAMTAEHINPGKGVVKQPERTWVREKLEPPPGWFVSMMPYSGTEWRDLGIFQHSGKLEIPAVDHNGTIEHNLGLTFIGIGHLFLLIRHSTWDRIWDILGFDTPHVHRIWPIKDSGIGWPAPYVITDIEAEYFTTYLARVVDQRV